MLKLLIIFLILYLLRKFSLQTRFFFLIDNCLDVKETRQSFTPKFPIEIKQEIDRLEKKKNKKRHNDKKKDKGRQDKVNQERPDVGNDNEVLNADDDKEQKKEPKKINQPKPQNKSIVKPSRSATHQRNDDNNKPEDDGGMEIIPNDKPKNEPLPPQDIEEPNDDNSVELGYIDDKGNGVVVVTNDEGEQV